ncbi:MAG: GDP-mannose 4,6-dehydratase [Myxococcales bacterium]|nr:GDP-mannose 4,6-dehydratase [Myxococcota bacterium]MDW8281225.1 GDP-mannose 4,6-dehydratase [Myxococcales bacterium]
MRYLITGGAGFVGSHLAEELLRRSHEVYVIDDLSTGTINNIRHLKTHDRFHYVVDTCSNRMLMAELVDEVDIIFHLAAAVGVKLIVESPVRTIETNIKLTEIVLDAANKKKKPVFVASTSECYGKSDQIPFNEEGDLVLGPSSKGRWSYACSKLIDEFLAIAYFREKKLPTVVGRLFNTVGPRQTGQYGMVVPTFVRQALRGEPLTVYGDGQQSRCFTHVADVVRALIGLMDTPAAYGQVVNIGNTEEITILELARRVIEMTRSSSDIVFVPYEKAYEPGFEDMPRRVPDLSKVRNLIGWQPTIGLEQILRDVIDYCRRG